MNVRTWTQQTQQTVYTFTRLLRTRWSYQLKENKRWSTKTAPPWSYRCIHPVTSAPALPSPGRLGAPGCPASRAPIHPSRASALLDSPGLTYHLFISSPIFVNSLLLDCIVFVFSICLLTLVLSRSMSVFIKCFTPGTFFVSPALSHVTHPESPVARLSVRIRMWQMQQQY